MVIVENAIASSAEKRIITFVKGIILITKIAIFIVYTE